MDSQIQTTSLGPVQRAAGKTKPYAPSNIDRFIGLVDRLPGPYWLTFLLLLVLQTIVVHVLAWMDGWLPAYTLNPILFMFPVWLWTPLAMIRYLNAVSLEALASFNSLLNLDEEQREQLRHEFTTMPARGLFFSGAFWAVVYVLLTYFGFEKFYVSYGLGTFFSVSLLLAGLASFSIGSAIYYHSLRQLRLVHRTVKLVNRVNLFQLEPVYAFSRLTARTGVSWMIMLSLSLLTYPLRLANAGFLAVLAVQGLLALAAFVLPLRSVNHHLVSEKRRLVAELNQRVERTLERLHLHIDGNDLSEIEQINDAVAALNAEREILTRIPTWPWRTETLTSFLSAMVLPILLFLIQLVVARWFGG
jgi:hypothetical protein